MASVDASIAAASVATCSKPATSAENATLVDPVPPVMVNVFHNVPCPTVLPKPASVLAATFAPLDAVPVKLPGFAEPSALANIADVSAAPTPPALELNWAFNSPTLFWACPKPCAVQGVLNTKAPL